MPTPDERRVGFAHAGNGNGAPTEHSRTRHWFALNTRSRAERKALLVLERGGIDAYLPLVEEERQWSDRKVRVAAPLFPGYVFARFSSARLVEVLQLPYVARVAGTNGHPSPVRDEELASVRKLVEGSQASDVIPKPVEYLTPGDEVVVTGTAFAGMRGTLIQLHGREYVAVRIDALRQARAVRISRERVERVEEG